MLHWSAKLSHNPTQDTTPERVVATLDAEMARLELSLSRSGWTSWAGTAALGGLAWVFISLLDDATQFPWSTFVLLTTLLSFIQDLIYGLSDVLRPQRGHGLLVGGQSRILVSRETLPFARKQYCLDLARAGFLAVASFFVLPEILGWLWWLPFIAYLLTCVAMTTRIVLSTLLRAIPKKEKIFLRVLVRQFVPACLAIAVLTDLAGSWRAEDFVALEGAALLIAASHVIRGLARPQFELPALDKLREVRRRLGFGQITLVQAIEQAEATLYGYSSMRLLSAQIKAFTRGFAGFAAQVRDMAGRVSTLANHLKSLGSSPGVTQAELRIGEALLRDALAAQDAVLATSKDFTSSRHTLVAQVERFKQDTHNDTSIPTALEIIRGGSVAFSLGIMQALRCSKLIPIHTTILEAIASASGLPLTPHLLTEVRAAQTQFGEHMTAMNLPAASTTIAPKVTT